MARAIANRRARTRRDALLWVLIAAAVVSLIALTVPIVGSVRLMQRYHDFTLDLSSSASFGQKHDSIAVEVDGEPRAVGNSQVSRLIQTIVSEGMGKPRDAASDPDSLSGSDSASNGFRIVVSFGDGSTLTLSPVAITEQSRLRDEGLLIRYTYPDGRSFSYDTDRLGYEDVLAILS